MFYFIHSTILIEPLLPASCWLGTEVAAVNGADHRSSDLLRGRKDKQVNGPMFLADVRIALTLFFPTTEGPYIIINYYYYLLPFW
jgi:hypothetical protein